MGAMGRKNQSILGRSLRSARRAAGLSVREVERRLRALGYEISHMTIYNYERGLSTPSAVLMDGFSTVYGLSQDWFAEDRPVLQGVRYRALKSVTVVQRASYEAEASRWLETYRHVERILGRIREPLRLPFRAATSGEALAKKIRKEHQLGEYPVPSVIRLLENFGVRVISLDTALRIDAFAGTLGDTSVVVLNTRRPSDRVRLNAAHELAHHLFSDCAGSGRLSEKDLERRAFECASHLLIPQSQLKAAIELQSMVRLVQYKERFGISLAAMIYRARESGLIRARVYERLWKEFAKLGWRKNEPGHVSPDRPVRMESLIDAAVRQKKTTYAELSLIVGIEEQAIRRRVYAAMGGSPLEEEHYEGDGSVYRFEDFA